MKNWVFGLVWMGGMLTGSAARAQYSAPGFPMLPQHREVPAPAPPDPTALPRFWHEADANKKEAGRSQFFEAVMAKAEYPAAAKPAKGQPAALMPTGRLFISVLVRSDGSVRQPPKVTKRELARPESDYPPAAVHALDAEALRVLGSLRFVRSRAAVDSLVVPMRFIAQ